MHEINDGAEVSSRRKTTKRKIETKSSSFFPQPLPATVNKKRISFELEVSFSKFRSMNVRLVRFLKVGGTNSQAHKSPKIAGKRVRQPVHATEFPQHDTVE